MKKLSIVLLCLVFSLSFCFACVGYAALSSSMSVTGTAATTAQIGVYISKVEIAAGSNIDVKDYYGTNLNSTVTLQKAASSTATLTVTLYNNSTNVYAFKKTAYMVGQGTYDNENITFTLNGLKAGDTIAGGATLSFTVTFSYAGSNRSNQTLNSLLNFQFGDYLPGVAGSFSNILNSETTYTQLDQGLDSGGDRLGNTTFIGNVPGANSNDTTLMNKLFGSSLKVEIDGDEKPVTAIVKRENLDGDSTTGDENGNEMTLYMTADTIKRGVKTVTVFAIVFTKEPGSDEWVQMGDMMFEGTADACRYLTGLDGGLLANNSFNTGTWESTKSYYNAGAGSSIKEIVSAYLSQA